MRKRIDLALACLLAMILFLSPWAVVYAQQGEYVLDYEETFDQDQAPGWEFIPQNDEFNSWRVVNSRLEGYGSARTNFLQRSWGDGILSFLIFPNDLDSLLAAEIRISEQGLYSLAMQKGDQNTLYIYMRRQIAGVDPNPILVQESETFYNPELEYRVEIQMQGGLFQVYLRPFKRQAVVGERPPPSLVYEDDEPLLPGGIGFLVDGNSIIWVDDVQVHVPAPVVVEERIDGQVFEGEPVNRERPLPGITIFLFASNNPYPDQGKLVGELTTDEGGHFSFILPAGVEFYGLRLEPPPGFEPVAAESAGGIIREPAYIEFTAPLNEAAHQDNFFWLLSNAPPPPITEAPPPPTDTPRPIPPTPEQPSPTPFEPDEGTSGGLPLWPFVAGGGVAVLVGLGGVATLIYLLRRLRKPPQTPRPPQEPPEEPPEGPPILPILPPVRLMQVWLTQGAERGGRRLYSHQALTAGVSYSLNIQIPEVPRQKTSGPQPAEGSQAGATTNFTLMIFTPDEDFAVVRTPATMHVPERSASNLIHRSIFPKTPGRRRLRVCMYYGNLLVQSALVEADVFAADTAGNGNLLNEIDYVANASLNDLQNLPQPTLNLFTNQTTDGTHWLGVYTATESGHRLHSGFMQTFSESQLKERARELRELLAQIQGFHPYRFEHALPLDGVRMERIDRDLSALALRGWVVFHSLFLASGNAENFDRLPEPQQPGLVSIARCRGESPTLPWAALYDLRLDTSRPEQIHLCSIYKSQLAANRWSSEGDQLIEKHDLLDNLRACRAQPDCPLKGPQRKQTVCPFGFWGYIHQIEQPLQNVTPTPIDRIPPELQTEQIASRFYQSPALLRSAGETMRVAIGAYPDIPDATQHAREIMAASPYGRMELLYSEDRDQVLNWLEQGNRHLYYFYCHGILRDGQFRLLLGPSGDPRSLSAADLDPREDRWTGNLQPLVFFNGCETMRVSPELIYGFLGVLKDMGASGVIGTEIPVVTGLARPVGVHLVNRLISGLSLGEAFLDLRRHMQRQGNPLGLAYTYYSPAALHLHDPQNCAWCQSRLGL